MIYLVAIVTECLLLVLTFVRTNSATDCITLAAAHTICFVLYGIASYSKKLKQTPLWLILGFALLFRVTLVFQPVLASDDIYRYMWDGNTSTHGINPYLYTPNDSTLTALHSPILPAKVNVPYLKSVYPPFAQVVFTVSYSIFGESQTGIKSILLLFDCATLFVLLSILRYKNIPLQSITLWAWNPLVYFVTELDGHIEIIAIFFFVCLLYCIVCNYWRLGSIALGLAALVKPQPIGILAPLSLVLFKQKQYKMSLVFIAGTLAIFIGGYALYWEPTWSITSAFITMSKRWYYNNPPFDIAHLFLTNESAHTVTSILLALWVAVFSMRKNTAINHTYMYVLGILLLSPMVQPWYLLWALVFITFRWSPAIFLYSFTIIVCYKTVFQWQAYHVWQQQWWELCIEYIPVYLLLLIEWLAPQWLHQYIPPVLQSKT